MTVQHGLDLRGPKEELGLGETAKRQHRQAGRGQAGRDRVVLCRQAPGEGKCLLLSPGPAPELISFSVALLKDKLPLHI